MNDLMTKSFFNYADLKKQAQKDIDLEARIDLEIGQLSNTEEENLSHFFQEVEAIKVIIQEIAYLLNDLQSLNESTKSTLSSKILRGLQDRMDSDIVTVLRKAKLVKERLEALDKSNMANTEGSAVNRTRIITTNGLKGKLKEIMMEFQQLREKILSDYKESLRRRYYNATGEVPSEEVIEKLVSGNEKIEIFEGNLENNKERHEAVMDIQKSLNKLHQVFLDMAVLVDTQGEQIDNIEQNVMKAGSYVSGGTNSLFYAKQMKKKNKNWVFWLCVAVLFILLVVFIFIITS